MDRGERVCLHFTTVVVVYITIVSVKVNISIYCYSADIRINLWLDKELDRMIDVTAILFLLAQNRQQTHDWIIIGWGANGLGIQEWYINTLKTIK